MAIEDETHNESQITVPGDATDPLLTESERDGDDDTGHDEFNGASFSGAVFNHATTMKILRLVPGIAMFVLVAFLTDTTIEFLLRFSRIGKKRSYDGLMEDSFGKIGRVMLQVSVLVSNIGVLIVYMIIIGDVLAGKNEYGIHHA